MIRPAIDMGHGGADHGATWGDIREKDLTLELGLRLERSLQGTALSPLLTRRDDVDPSWSERYEAVKGADFAISIHVNAHQAASNLHGAEAYHWPGNDCMRQVGFAAVHGMPFELSSSKVIAATNEPGPDDDWLQRPRTVLKAFREIPTCLIEVGYLTNEEDRRFLTTPFALDCITCGLRSAVFRAALIFEGRVV